MSHKISAASKTLFSVVNKTHTNDMDDGRNTNQLALDHPPKYNSQHPLKTLYK